MLNTHFYRWQNIFQFGLEGKIDRTIFISNLRTSLKEHLPLIAGGTALETVGASNSGESSQQSSGEHAQVFMSIYLIGIGVAILAFTVEWTCSRRCSANRKKGLLSFEKNLSV